MTTGSTVFEQAAKAARRAYLSAHMQGQEDRDALWEAALEAAAPLLAPQPVDREALKQAIRAAANSEQSIGVAVWVDGTLNDFTDAVLALLNGRRS